jgi:hypothetical protein
MILIFRQNNHIILIIINTSFDQSFKFNINNKKLNQYKKMQLNIIFSHIILILRQKISYNLIYIKC